jgi:hypothetical protein
MMDTTVRHTFHVSYETYWDELFFNEAYQPPFT